MGCRFERRERSSTVVYLPGGCEGFTRQQLALILLWLEIAACLIHRRNLIRWVARRWRQICVLETAETPLTMELLTYEPPLPLKRYVAYFWSLRRPQNGRLALKMFANGVSGIIVQHHNGRSALIRATGTQAAGGHAVPTAFIYGKRTGPGQLIADGPFDMTGVVFRAQALYTLLKINPVEVSNGPVSVDDVFVDNLADQLLNAETASERLDVLGGCLARRVDDVPDDVLVGEGLRLIRRQVQTVRIPAVLKRLGISERTFERRFKRSVGVSPHQYLRVVRFQQAVRLLRRQHFERLSDLASALGYTDQSHFIKEIREFAGCTPTDLRDTVRTAFDLPCALILASRAPANHVGQEPSSEWRPASSRR
jgi:AraC-like DNA-binding protein